MGVKLETRARFVRAKVDPRLVTPEKAARRLGITWAVFERVRSELEAKGFPSPIPIVENYDLAAIDRWIDAESGIINDANPEGARLAMMKAIAGMR